MHGFQQGRHERFAFAGGNHVGEQGERLRVHEGYRAADQHQRMAVGPLLGAQRQPGQSQQGEDVGVVPLERDGEREDVEVVDRRLRLDRDNARAGLEEGVQLLLGWQEHALAHDVGLIVEEPVNRLEAQI